MSVPTVASAPTDGTTTSGGPDARGPSARITLGMGGSVEDGPFSNKRVNVTRTAC